MKRSAFVTLSLCSLCSAACASPMRLDSTLDVLSGGQIDLSVWFDSDDVTAVTDVHVQATGMSGRDNMWLFDVQPRFQFSQLAEGSTSLEDQSAFLHYDLIADHNGVVLNLGTDPLQAAWQFDETPLAFYESGLRIAAVNVSAVPEPTAGVLALALTLLDLGRRKRHHAI